MLKQIKLLNQKHSDEEDEDGGRSLGCGRDVLSFRPDPDLHRSLTGQNFCTFEDTRAPFSGCSPPGGDTRRVQGWSAGLRAMTPADGQTLSLLQETIAFLSGDVSGRDVLCLLEDDDAVSSADAGGAQCRANLILLPDMTLVNI